MQSADLKAKLTPDGVEPAGTSAAEFAQIIRTDIEKFGRIVKAVGVRIE